MAFDINQTFFWDGNVVGMETDDTKSFYLQDDLGSTMQLLDETGDIRESYAYDEFGANVYTARDIFTNPMQPFGYTGYQMDAVGGLYFAQARRYDANVGRFVSEDIVKGSIIAPFTMNHYGYCWNRPMDLVDLNGMWPSLSDVEAGIKNMASSAIETVSQMTDSALGVVGDFYDDHKETIDTTMKIVGTVAVVAGAVALTVATGGAAAGVGVAVAAGVAGTIGGAVNVKNGGSFINGFCGGAIDTAIVAVGGAILPGVIAGAAGITEATYAIKFGAGVISNFAGGSSGSVITNLLNNADSESEKKEPKKILEEALISGGIQTFLSGTFGSMIDIGAQACTGAASVIASVFSNGYGALSTVFGDIVTSIDKCPTEE